MRGLIFIVAVLALSVSPALAGKLVSPVLRISPGGAAAPQVALTLDLCSGGTDMRILTTLIANQVPATLFVTGRWLRANPVAIKLLLAHPELFELEDHGDQHIPAVLGKARVYGIKPAGTVAAIAREVGVGAADVLSATGAHAVWYRDATALYSPAALSEIGALGYRVAGYSLNGDDGASLPAADAAKTIAHAHDGDVIIAHMNQPRRSSGVGVVAGILALKAEGFRFVRLEDVAEISN